MEKTEYDQLFGDTRPASGSMTTAEYDQLFGGEAPVASPQPTTPAALPTFSSGFDPMPVIKGLPGPFAKYAQEGLSRLGREQEEARRAAAPQSTGMSFLPYGGVNQEALHNQALAEKGAQRAKRSEVDFLRDLAEMEIEGAILQGKGASLPPRKRVLYLPEGDAKRAAEASRLTLRYVVAPGGEVFLGGSPVDVRTVKDSSLAHALGGGSFVSPLKRSEGAAGALEDVTGQTSSMEDLMRRKPFLERSREFQKQLGAEISASKRAQKWEGMKGADGKVSALDKHMQEFRGGFTGSLISPASFAARAFGNDALADELDRKKSSLEAPTPEEERTLLTKLSGGAGSMVAFVVPGAGVGGTLAKMGKGGRWMASLIAGSMEAAAEGGDAYTSGRAQGMTDEEAKKAMWKTFAANIPLNVLLDKVGVLNSEAGSSLRRIAKAQGAEAAQEAAQQIIQNTALGRPWNEGVGESALVGGILGGGMKAGMQASRALTAAQLNRERAARSAMGPRPLEGSIVPPLESPANAQIEPAPAPAPAEPAPQGNVAPAPAAPAPEEQRSREVDILAGRVQRLAPLAEELTARAAQNPNAEEIQSQAVEAQDLLQAAKDHLAYVDPAHPLLAQPEPAQVAGLTPQVEPSVKAEEPVAPTPTSALPEPPAQEIAPSGAALPAEMPLVERIAAEARQAKSDPDAFLAAYEKTHGNHINGDQMAEMFPSVAGNPTEGHALAVQDGTVADLAEQAFDRRLAQPAQSPDEQVLITIGNAASGKTSISGKNKDAFQTILDTTAENGQGLVRNINKVLKSGREPVLLFVHAPIDEAVRRNMTRGEGEGRYVPILDQAGMEVQTVSSFLHAWDVFGHDPKVHFSAIENTEEGGGKKGVLHGDEAVALVESLRPQSGEVSLLDKAHRAYIEALESGHARPSKQARSVLEQGLEGRPRPYPGTKEGPGMGKGSVPSGTGSPSGMDRADGSQESVTRPEPAQEVAPPAPEPTRTFTVGGEKITIPPERDDLIKRFDEAQKAHVEKQAEITAKIPNATIRAKKHKLAGDDFAKVKRGIADALVKEEPAKPSLPIPKELQGIPGLERAGGFYEIPTSEIHADPDRFQYKKQNETTGVQQIGKKGASGSLAGVTTWNPESAGVVDVWLDPKDKKVYVVNGHNRYDKAVELGVGKLKARFLDASNAKEALQQGALQNISEGNGTALDAATWFRGSGSSVSDLEAMGIPTNKPMVKEGLALSRLSDTWFRAAQDDPDVLRLAVETGNAGMSKGQEDTALRELVSLIGKKGGADGITTAYWKDMLDQIKSSRSGGTVQTNLFGEEEYQSTLAQQTDLIRYIRAKLKAEKQVGNVLTGKRYQETLGQAASVDTQKAHTIKDEASADLGLFEQQKHLVPIGDIINDHATSLSNAASPAAAEAIRNEALKLVRESLGGMLQRGSAKIGSEGRSGVQGKGEGQEGTGLFEEGGLKPDEASADGIQQLQGATHPLATFLQDIFGKRERADTVAIGSEFEEVEKRWQNARKGAPITPLFSKAIESLRKAKAACTRHFDHIDPNESPLMAQVNEVLRQYEAGPAFAKAVAHDMVYEVTKNLGPKRQDLFTRILVLRDIQRNVKEGLDTGLEELPFGYKNSDEAQADLDKFEKAVKDPENKPIQDALNLRNTMSRGIVETLVNHGLLAEEHLDNIDSYYHRQVMTHLANDPKAPAGSSGGDMHTKKKGFQLARKGGAHDFNVRYAQAEAEWVSDAMSIIVKKETLDRLEAISDIRRALKAEASVANRIAYEEAHPDLSPEETGAVTDEEIAQALGSKAKTWRDLIPETHTIWQPTKGNHFYPAISLSERVLDQFLSGEIESIDKEDFKKVLALGGKKKEWVVPRNLAMQLDNMTDADRSEFGKAVVGLNSTWKQWQLISPMRVLRYNLNNMAGDLDATMAYNPRIVTRHFIPAARDLWRYMISHRASPDVAREIRETIRLGVVDAGLTMAEIPDIEREGAFRLLTSDGPLPNLIQRFWGGVKTFTAWRENILRLAAYRFFQEELKSGRRLYAASNRGQVEALTNDKDKAAKLARELLGDYGNVSVAGQYIRTHMIPFYSWMEVNAPRYVQLLKNLPHEGESGKDTGRSRTAAAARLVAVKAPMLALRMAIMFGLIYLWNELFFKEEYSEVRRDRSVKNAIILGRRSDGSIRYLRTDLAIMDALEWFSLADLPMKVKGVLEGKVTPADILADAAKGPAEKVIKGWEPLSKTIFELVLGRSISYPSAWREGASMKSGGMTIRDKTEYVLKNITPLDRLWDKVTRKPERKKGAGDSIVDLLLAYSVDPGEASYYLSRDIVTDWRKKNLGKKRHDGGGTPDEKENALYYFKRASQWGDEKNAAYWLKQYYDLGGKPNSIPKAIKNMHPLAGIPAMRRKSFLDGLPPNDRAIVDSALKWYQRVAPEMRGVAPETSD